MLALLDGVRYPFRFGEFFTWRGLIRVKAWSHSPENQRERTLLWQRKLWSNVSLQELELNKYKHCKHAGLTVVRNKTIPLYEPRWRNTYVRPYRHVLIQIIDDLGFSHEIDVYNVHWDGDTVWCRDIWSPLLVRRLTSSPVLCTRQNLSMMLSSSSSAHVPSFYSLIAITPTRASTDQSFLDVLVYQVRQATASW